LESSEDGENFTQVRSNQEDGNFKGLSATRENIDSVFENEIVPPVRARYFRLRPTQWNLHISLRWQLYEGSGAMANIELQFDFPPFNFLV